jgi:hypothetical protein
MVMICEVTWCNVSQYTKGDKRECRRGRGIRKGKRKRREKEKGGVTAQGEAAGAVKSSGGRGEERGRTLVRENQNSASPNAPTPIKLKETTTTMKTVIQTAMWILAAPGQ